MKHRSATIPWLVSGCGRDNGVAAEWFWPKHSVSYRRPRSSVAVLNADEYSEKIEALLMDGLRLFRLNVLGKSFSSNQIWWKTCRVP